MVQILDHLHQCIPTVTTQETDEPPSSQKTTAVTGLPLSQKTPAITVDVFEPIELGMFTYTLADIQYLPFWCFM